MGGVTLDRPDGTFDITLEPQTERYPARASETILQALERNGLSFPAFCRHGHCGLCRAALRSGTVAPSDGPQPAETLIGAGEVLICASRPVSDLTLTLSWGAGRAPEIPARVVALQALRPDIHRLVLRLPRVQPFHFAPGQFVLLHGAGGVRAYALANPPHERHPELHIQSIPGGRLRQALCALTPGSLVTLEGPLGPFYYRPPSSLPDPATLLVACGMGYAPMKSILRHLYEREGDPSWGPVDLIWETPTEEALYDHDWLCRLAAAWPRFHYHPRIVPEHKGPAPRGLPAALAARACERLTCYLAGSPRPVVAWAEHLLACGIPEGAIYREPFGTETASAAPLSPSS